MNSSYVSDSKSVRTTGGGLANRLTFALSCVARSYKNGVTEENSKECDEEVADLEQVLKEFNDIVDLTVKYNSQLKICKIVEANDESVYGSTKNSTSGEKESVKSIMFNIRDQLQALIKDKEQEIETVQESFAEQKVSAMFEIKRKYEKMLTMIKVAMAKPGSN